MEALNCVRQFCEWEETHFQDSWTPSFLPQSHSPSGAQVSHCAPWMRYLSWWGEGHLEQREQALHACRGQAAMREPDGPDRASTLESRALQSRMPLPKLPQSTVP